MDMAVNLSSRFVEEVSKRAIGREDAIRLMVVALLSQGHILLEGNPGLGKTTLAKAFSETIGAEFHRIQMTPDTLPADILGTYVFDQRDATFEFRKGPIFANVVLVDELNRATPKAQAGLLEAMQERQVSLEGKTTKFDEPFMVLATQVPFGSPGTYPLSEVQADRFAFSMRLGYPSFEDELKIVGSIDAIERNGCEQVISSGEIVKAVEMAKRTYVSSAVTRYIVSLVSELRRSPTLRIQPGTRAAISLLKGSRALAWIEGRDHVLPDDVKSLAPFVLLHRVFLTSDAAADEVTPAAVVGGVLERVPVPKER